ncbi:PLP-dependent aminotransferase family protein [Spirillospora sp. CA-294931]|uniref:MocR-like pyridoxine biosynthesis transcription factor PdxR n=1 Tax=Spirillospora sp. CA-294931 TaxID=3240042 RepID=UPI003D8DADAE
MAVEWTGSDPELSLRLDRTLGEPLRVQLEGALRRAIQSGRLEAGERIPSTRRLAAELGVSRGLVVDCYAQLESEGYLSSRPGSVTRVAEGARSTPVARRPEIAPLLAPLPPGGVDFRPIQPDLSSFPRRDWLWALGEAGRRAPGSAFGYGEAQGSGRLREVLASYLRRVRGAVAEPELMVISGGFAQGLALVLDALAARGVRRVAVEEPGPAYRDVVTHRAGVEAVPVPVDEGGIDVGALAATGAGAVLLTPAHQSPTGVVLTPERRHAVLAWARERDGLVIEDDYDAEFRYDREPVGTLQGLAPDRVVLLGTVSKSLAPGLRLGWVLSPPGLVAAVGNGKRYADRGSPALDQLALATLLESGRFDRHLRRMRKVYGARRAVLREALHQRAPRVRVGGLAAGLHAVAHLPGDLDEERVVREAMARSVGLHGMSHYRIDGATRPPALVLGFGHLTEGAIGRGVASIADLLA